MSVVIAYRNEPHQKFCQVMLDSGEQVMLRIDPSGLTIERLISARAPGAILFRESEPGDCMYLLVHGMVSIVLRAPNDPDKTIRLVTFAPGVVFGELALLQGSPRSADGICDTECTVYSISRSALERLGAQNHLIAIKVYKALALILADRLRRTTTELRHAITQ